MRKENAFWVFSSEIKAGVGFGRMPVPAQFKALGDAKRYCRELNLKKGLYHAGYFIEERNGGLPITPLWNSKVDDSGDDAD